jgi:ferredoxin
MAPPPLGVKVNLVRCTGAEDCVRICPEVFSMDRYGYPMVRPFDGNDREIRTRLREAIARCPEGAIVAFEPAP